MTTSEIEPRKTYISVRPGKHTIQVRRSGYKQKSTKLCTIKRDLSDSSKVEPLLINDIERQRWQQEKQKLIKQHKSQKRDQITEQGLDNALLEIYYALDALQKLDPRCDRPENQNLARRIWLTWQLIRPILSSTSKWGIKEEASRALLKGRKVSVDNILHYLATTSVATSKNHATTEGGL